jgi:type IV pilus assembly protein PilC
MIDAGIALAPSLDILAKKQSDPKFRQVVHSIRQQVEQGNTLSSAMAMHPDYFDPSYIAAVRQGEKSGALEVALNRLARR